MLPEHLLHLVALARACSLLLSKWIGVRLPVAVSVLAQAAAHRMSFQPRRRWLLHIAEVDALSQRIVYRIGAARCIFAQINLRSLAVVMVVIILMVQEPARLLVIMLVYGINPALVFAGDLPTLNIIGRREVERAVPDTRHLYLRILLLHRLADHQVALLEIGRDEVFVADAYHLEVERSRMASIGSHLSPLRGGRVAIRPLYQGLAHPGYTAASRSSGFRPADQPLRAHLPQSSDREHRPPIQAAARLPCPRTTGNTRRNPAGGSDGSPRC